MPIHFLFWPSLMAQMVKKLPAVQETQVQFLDWEDTRAKGMVTHSDILAWRIPQTEEPGRLQSTESQGVGHNGATNTHAHMHKHTILTEPLAISHCHISGETKPHPQL